MAARQEGSVLLQSLLGCLLTDDKIERVLGFDKFEQSATLPFDQRLLELAKAAAIHTPSRQLALSQQYVEARQAQTVGEFRQFCRREVHHLAQLFSLVGGLLAEALAFVRVRQRQLQGSDVRALHQALVDLGKLVGEQAEGHIDALDVGILRPTEKADEVCALAAPQAAQFAGRHEVLSIVEDNREAWPGLVLFEKNSLDELVQQKEHRVR